MSKLSFIYFLAFFVSSYGFALHDDNSTDSDTGIKRHNISCHICRANTTTRSYGKIRGQNYCKDESCRMVYCDRCLELNLNMIDPCPVCSGECCCYYELCTKSHRHCHTYNRTLKRHAKKSLFSHKKKKVHENEQPAVRKSQIKIFGDDSPESVSIKENDGKNCPYTLKVSLCYEDAEILYNQLGEYLKNLN